MRIAADHPIHDYIAKHPDMPWHGDAQRIIASLDDRDMYSYADLLNMCGKAEVDSALVAATSILTTCRGAIFQIRILFIDDDNEQFMLPPAAAQKVMDDQPIAHPVTGRIVQNPQSQTYIIFELRTEEAVE